jgi:7,8-dihydropterin-6-yl-methyl-4-(beta-D-ribofuranosyl)aminobenzene 5'-phosphate synthase
MGQSEIFAENAKILDVDLEKVDAAFLSHGHFDHGGGLARFLKINKKAKVYLAPDAFGEHFSGKDRYIGLEPALKEHRRMVFCPHRVSPLEGISFCPITSKSLPDTFDDRMLVRRFEGWLRDPFLHERVLLLEEKGKRILISGCSHRGLLNILDEFEPDVFIGGFHFMKVETNTPYGRKLLEAAAYKIFSSNTLFYTGHCTGDEQFAFLKTMVGEKLQELHTGSVIEI